MKHCRIQTQSPEIDKVNLVGVCGVTSKRCGKSMCRKLQKRCLKAEIK